MHKVYPKAIAISKITLSAIRIFLGVIIIIMKFSLGEVNQFLFNRYFEGTTGHYLFNYFQQHIIAAPVSFTAILAFSLIIISSVELVYSFALLHHHKIGAKGLFVISILWIPVELLFLSQFFILSKVSSIIINVVLLGLLADLLLRGQSYFED